MYGTEGTSKMCKRKQKRCDIIPLKTYLDKGEALGARLQFSNERCTGALSSVQQHCCWKKVASRKNYIRGLQCCKHVTI
jgi:hypothetical protein